MAKSKKKKSSGAKSAVRKPARKLHARKTGHKTPVRTKKTTRRSPKANLQSTESAAAVLLGLNHREKKLDPFVRKQKQKLLQLRDAVVDSMAGVAQAHLGLVLKAVKRRLSECTRPMPVRTHTIAILR